jgi:excisionase family DNA binding protein
MEKLLVRPSEAAEMLGLGRSKVYAMLASGELPSVRIGKSVRVPTEALRRWVQEQVDANDAPVHVREHGAVPSHELPRISGEHPVGIRSRRLS